MLNIPFCNKIGFCRILVSSIIFVLINESLCNGNSVMFLLAELVLFYHFYVIYCYDIDYHYIDYRSKIHLYLYVIACVDKHGCDEMFWEISSLCRSWYLLIFCGLITAHVFLCELMYMLSHVDVVICIHSSVMSQSAFHIVVYLLGWWRSWGKIWWRRR